jgi:glutathione-regulated potassium-efflux system ancillary protein KefC
MNPLWIFAAFLFGAVISRIGLPPLVGYLLAGFALNSIGIAGGELLETVADAGVTLLLFTIGLKLKIKSLAKPEVWAGTSIHMIFTVILFGVLIRMLGFSGIHLRRVSR